MATIVDPSPAELGGNQERTGEIDLAAVLTRDSVPASGTVRCDLVVEDDRWVALGPVARTGAIDGAIPVTFVASDRTHVEVCTVVSFDGGGTTEDCEPVEIHSAVVGHILIDHTGGAPTFTVSGVLATHWTCSDNQPATPYRVTCVPLVPTGLTWHCDVLHADVLVVAAGTTARTALDCDGGGPAEATTATVSGIGGHDTAIVPNDVLVTEFSCIVDDGDGGGAAPGYHAGCGDPPPAA